MIPAPTAGRRSATGAVTTTDGRKHNLTFGLTTDPRAAFDEFRVVILDTGQLRGNKTATARRISTGGDDPGAFFPIPNN